MASSVLNMFPGTSHGAPWPGRQRRRTSPLSPSRSEPSVSLLKNSVDQLAAAMLSAASLPVGEQAGSQLVKKYYVQMERTCRAADPDD